MFSSMKCLVFCGLITQALTANILILNSVASPSHHIYNRALAVGLAKDHNITFVSADVSDKKHPNIHYIHLEKVYDFIYEGDETFDLMAMSEESPIEGISAIYDYMRVNCDGVLASDGLEIILNYPNDFKFDVVIHDFTCGPCLLPLVHKFNYPPLVAITAFGIPPYTGMSIGGQKYPAYIPHYNLNYPTDMTFSQRFFNTFLYALDVL
jgi:glucuronosyltransferase